MQSTNLFKAITMSALAIICQTSNAASTPVSAQLNAPKANLQANDEVVVDFTLTNNSATDQYILKTLTPFDGIQGALFDVTRDGVKVAYLGALVKRVAPTANDYFLLKPGKSYTKKVKLSELYDMSVTGDYMIRYRATNLNVLSNGVSNKNLLVSKVDSIQSDVLTLFINGRLPRGTTASRQTPPSLSSAGSVSYSNCTAAQSSTIGTAMSAARGMASESASYFAAGNADLRYKTWFGNYDASRYTLGKSHFNSIRDAFVNQPVNVNCSCTAVSDPSATYAYVYPSQPYKIYVCGAFWSAPVTGTDSQGGTLVHEMSHFTAVAGTQDIVYGQAGSRSLALSNPANALQNADSHEYFAENTPASTSAIFSQARGNYSISKVGTGFSVSDNTGADGIQFFSSIYRLKFTDVSVALDLDGNAGKVYRLYQAAFNRVPDLGGLGFWIAQKDNGTSLQAIADGFINSAEFTNLYGANPSHEVFLTKVYDNVLHRAPDQAGYDYWLSVLYSGTPRADVLAGFSESAENKAQVAAAISSGISYTRYGAKATSSNAVLISPFVANKK